MREAWGRVKAWPLWRPDPRRAVVLAAIGAASGLGVAGFGLFTAKGASRFVPPEDVALVNQHPILFTDFQAQLEAEESVSPAQATPAQRAKVLNEMIREELFVQRGVELDLMSSDPDTRTALVAGVEQQSAAEAVADTPSRETLQAFYHIHLDRYASEGQLLVRDFVPAAKARADALAGGGRAAAARPSLTALSASGAWREVPRSTEADFYFAAKIHLGDRLFEAARGLASGQARFVPDGPGGPHLLVVVLNTPPKAQPFEAVEARVANDFRDEQRAKDLAAETQYLRAKAEILMNPTFR